MDIPEWFDPSLNFHGPEWDEAWHFGATLGRLFNERDWATLEPRAQEMWTNVNACPSKTWQQARPAIYAAWRASCLPIPPLQFARGLNRDIE